jgi:hypothetical protein
MKQLTEHVLPLAAFHWLHSSPVCGALMLLAMHGIQRRRSTLIGKHHPVVRTPERRRVPCAPTSAVLYSSTYTDSDSCKSCSSCNRRVIHYAVINQLTYRRLANRADFRPFDRDLNHLRPLGCLHTSYLTSNALPRYLARCTPWK